MRIALMLDRKETIKRNMLKWEPGMGMGDEPIEPDPKPRAIAERVWKCLGERSARRGVHSVKVEAVDIYDADGYLYTLIGEPF